MPKLLQRAIIAKKAVSEDYEQTVGFFVHDKALKYMGKSNIVGELQIQWLDMDSEDDNNRLSLQAPDWDCWNDSIVHFWDIG